MVAISSQPQCVGTSAASTDDDDMEICAASWKRATHDDSSREDHTNPLTKQAS